MSSVADSKYVGISDAVNDSDNLIDDYLTVFISGHIFGIPVLQVQDVLGVQNLTNVPLASSEIAGVLNLRGRIVTAIDVKSKLGLAKHEDESQNNRMSVVVEYKNELYSLLIDKVGDVLSLSQDDFENSPPTLEPLWKEMSSGIFRLKQDLLVVLDVSKIIGSLTS